MTEKYTPKKLPSVIDLAAKFCLVVAEWGFHYHPDQMQELYSGVLDEDGWALQPGDVCDDNMAMCRAFDLLGVDTDKVFETEHDELPEWFTDLFNAAYDQARDWGWLPRNLKPGEYVLRVWGEGYDPGASVVVIQLVSVTMGYDDHMVAQARQSLVDGVPRVVDCCDIHQHWLVRYDVS